MKSSDLKNKLSFLHKKKIAVIGNASSLFDHKYGEVIDAHDYIIRLNFGCINRPQCQGSRTDIVGFSVPLTNKWVQAHYGEPRLIWMSPKNRDDAAFFNAFDNTVYFYPIKLWKKLEVSLNKNRPSTGIMMLDLVSHFKPVQINLFGFDFKKTKTYYLKEDHAGPHNWALEQAYTEQLIKSVNGKIYE